MNKLKAKNYEILVLFAAVAAFIFGCGDSPGSCDGDPIDPTPDKERPSYDDRSRVMEYE
tara:strand:- start:342 stop:518 length:177 start_codon:yes stop_codon:yes gene_type:complete